MPEASAANPPAVPASHTAIIVTAPIGTVQGMIGR